MEDKSFYNLIQENRIRIPMIQRDYAEGRRTAKIDAIRKNFLNEMLKVVFHPETELKLDFVYGSYRDSAFEPLDGQQRLTTLFLLAWIFRSKERDLLRLPDDKNHSLFTYETRVASEEFCDTLVRYYACDLIEEWNAKKIAKPVPVKQENTELLAEPDSKRFLKVGEDEVEVGNWFFDESEKVVEKNNGKIKLSDVIKSKDWFKWGWHKDPTVTSMLVVIDTVMELIEENGYVYSTGISDRLNNITFKHLDLKELDMSDELYVKMNSRGKQLSDFDIVKSTLEEEIFLQEKQSSDFESRWREAVDGRWTNYFWQKSLKEKEEQKDLEFKDVAKVEDGYLRLLQRLIALNLWMDTKDKDEYKKQRSSFDVHSQAGFNQVLQKYLDMSFYKKEGKARILNLEQIMKDMDSLIYEVPGSESRYSDITTLLDGIHFSKNENLLDIYLKDNVSYDTLAIIASMLFYARKFECWKDGERDNFRYWMRFTRNVILNDNRYDKIDSPESLYDTLILLRDMIDEFSEKRDREGVNDIRAYIRDVNARGRRGIENERINEENRKADLRLQDSDWNELIDSAEENTYLEGQVCSLLFWANNDSDKFRTYSEYLGKIVGDDGLDKTDEVGKILFYAALLSLGDYRKAENGTLFNFTQHRDRGFKQYLRSRKDEYGNRIKELIDKWKDISPTLSREEFFNECIESYAVTGSWIDYVINCPQVLKYAEQKIVIKRKDGNWYLRQKIRSDVEHREIYLQSINCRIIYPKKANGDLDYNNASYPIISIKGNTDKEDPNSLTYRRKDTGFEMKIHVRENGVYSLEIDSAAPEELTAPELEKRLAEMNIICEGRITDKIINQ